MRDAPTGKPSKAKAKAKAKPQDIKGTDWQRLRRMNAKEIRAGIDADPDAHPTNAAFWKNATVVLPHRKAVITMRLDTDLLDWFRQEPGYQTRINAILRTYMQAHERTP